MSDAPPFDETLRHALAHLDQDDVRIFYDYFDELKAQVRKYLGSKAKVLPGTSAVAQSALLSLFCDLALQNIPLADVDEYGYPMLWPLLLKYVERHCNKWKAYYRAGKRQAGQTDLAAEPADHRAAANEESEFAAVCEALYVQLSPEDQVILEGRLKDETLEEIAQRINRSQTTVSNRLTRIRTLLETP